MCSMWCLHAQASFRSSISNDSTVPADQRRRATNSIEYATSVSYALVDAAKHPHNAQGVGSCHHAVQHNPLMLCSSVKRKCLRHNARCGALHRLRGRFALWGGSWKALFYLTNNQDDPRLVRKCSPALGLTLL